MLHTCIAELFDHKYGELSNVCIFVNVATWFKTQEPRISVISRMQRRVSRQTRGVSYGLVDRGLPLVNKYSKTP